MPGVRLGAAQLCIGSRSRQVFARCATALSVCGEAPMMRALPAAECSAVRALNGRRSKWLGYQDSRICFANPHPSLASSVGRNAKNMPPACFLNVFPPHRFESMRFVRQSISPKLARLPKWLGYQDSNLDSWHQKPESCRWTIPQRRAALPGCRSMGGRAW